MNIVTFILILTGVLLNAAAQLSLKAGTNNLGELTMGNGRVLSMALKIGSDPYIIMGLGCYVISVAVWIFALSRSEVSIAYPMLSIGYIVNAFAAHFLFGENLGFHRILAIGVIGIGVFLLSKS
jgi:multidrug transporter EmrE-like cation transporter